MNGQVHICLTRSPTIFPTAPAIRPRSSAACRPARRSHFAVEAPPGDYALSVIHDENGNGRLDTRLGIPREGFAFSNNPRIWFGPPSFTAARFTLSANGTALNVRMNYMF